MMMTGLCTEATTEAARRIVIVSHHRPELFDHLARRFRNSPDTALVFDYEANRLDLPVDAEGWRTIDALLSVVGYTIVRAA